DGVAYRWKRYVTDDPQGIVNLSEALGGGDGVGAYLYAEVLLEEDVEGFLKLGSDDAVACFLNGVKVHESPSDRGLTVDEDSVHVGFHKGQNNVLLKVTNSGGPWAACLRLTDSGGRPLRFVAT